jgi:hypothetical protein
VGLNIKGQDKDDAVSSHASDSGVSAGDFEAQQAIEAPSNRKQKSQSNSGATGKLDATGRETASSKPVEQIEIPSFLRKHG